MPLLTQEMRDALAAQVTAHYGNPNNAIIGLLLDLQTPPLLRYWKTRLKNEGSGGLGLARDNADWWSGAGEDAADQTVTVPAEAAYHIAIFIPAESSATLNNVSFTGPANIQLGSPLAQTSLQESTEITCSVSTGGPVIVRVGGGEDWQPTEPSPYGGGGYDGGDGIGEELL
ncbi:MAG: hypothetical protein KA004_17405 [Verrucomicrobiales bacterium]|nr:hypothetical protein [Verrucomicrobiales bacterium]